MRLYREIPHALLFIARASRDDKKNSLAGGKAHFLRPLLSEFVLSTLMLAFLAFHCYWACRTLLLSFSFSLKTSKPNPFIHILPKQWRAWVSYSFLEDINLISIFQALMTLPGLVYLSWLVCLARVKQWWNHPVTAGSSEVPETCPRPFFPNSHPPLQDTTLLFIYLCLIILIRC